MTARIAPVVAVAYPPPDFTQDRFMRMVEALQTRLHRRGIEVPLVRVHDTVTIGIYADDRPALIAAVDEIGFPKWTSHTVRGHTPVRWPGRGWPPHGGTVEAITLYPPHLLTHRPSRPVKAALRRHRALRRLGRLHGVLRLHLRRG